MTTGEQHRNESNTRLMPAVAVASPSTPTAAAARCSTTGMGSADPLFVAVAVTEWRADAVAGG